MERDFLGLGSKFSPITVKEENSDDSSRDSAHPSRGMKEWSLSSKKVGTCAPQLVSFDASQQDRRRNSVNDLSLSSGAFTPTTSIPNTFDQNWRTHYNTSSQEVRMFPISSQQEQTESVSGHGTLQSHFIRTGGKSFIDNSLGRSPIMAPPVSLFPATNSILGSTTDIRSSSKPPPPAQLTIFYGSSVSVYQDISPEKAQAIMLLAGNETQTKPVPMPKAQNPVHHSPAITHPPTYMPPSFLPSTSYTVSETASGSNGFGATQTTITTSLASTPRNNNQTDAYNNMAPKVGLPQSRKASLARFLEKRKERIINVSPYHVDNKTSVDSRTPMSECVSSSLSSSSTPRPI